MSEVNHIYEPRARVWYDSIKEKYTNNIIDIDKFLENYSDFINLHEEEINYLLIFRNVVKIIINMFESKMIKQICMDIASILEGSGKKYICGSGETLQTKRRIYIFRKEGNIYPQKKSGNYKRSRSLSQSISDINIKILSKKKKIYKYNIFKNNLTDYIFSINKNDNTILYDENIEKNMLISFNNDISSEMNTY